MTIKPNEQIEKRCKQKRNSFETEVAKKDPIKRQQLLQQLRQIIRMIITEEGKKKNLTEKYID